MPHDAAPECLSDVRASLRHVEDEGALAARLAAVQEHLVAWEGGDQEAGSVAADALDQLLGLLPDLMRTFESLALALPDALADLPASPE